MRGRGGGGTIVNLKGDGHVQPQPILIRSRFGMDEYTGRRRISVRMPPRSGSALPCRTVSPRVERMIRNDVGHLEGHYPSGGGRDDEVERTGPVNVLGLYHGPDALSHAYSLRASRSSLDDVKVGSEGLDDVQSHGHSAVEGTEGCDGSGGGLVVDPSGLGAHLVAVRADIIESIGPVGLRRVKIDQQWLDQFEGGLIARVHGSLSLRLLVFGVIGVAISAQRNGEAGNVVPRDTVEGVQSYLLLGGLGHVNPRGQYHVGDTVPVHIPH
mmetsp:Transcript_8019/g.23830  ORF Transcript_8019/g.23830 Transcript_8019/m.23830 type:complete len:269 (-) Transcript_8019:1059-1865(-)